MIQKIKYDEFCKMFDSQHGKLYDQFNLADKFNSIDTTYREANLEEFKEYVLYVLKKIYQLGNIRTKEENLEIFEKGWQENLKMLTSGGMSQLSLKPKYFRPIKFLRYNRKLIVSENLNLEHDLFTMIMHIIFIRYLARFDNIYELGCGSCQNLLLLSELFPHKRLFGFDSTSASIEIIKELKNTYNKNMEGAIFDMTNPSEIALSHDSVIITIHALEQIGGQYGKLLSFIIRSKPKIVVHFEPIIELYDNNELLDYLAITYTQKRNYLSGFYDTLCKLEKDKKIEIIEVRRPYVGGVIHESSLVVWRPIQ